MLADNILGGKVDITPDHLQGGVSQNLLQREDVSSIEQVVGGECVAAEVRMQPGDSGPST